MCSLLLKDLSFNFYVQMGKLHVDLDYFYDCVKDELDVRLNVHFISSNAKKVFFSLLLLLLLLYSTKKLSKSHVTCFYFSLFLF